MLLAFAIRVFVVQAFKIPSGSMIPTLLIGDHILVSKLSYGLQWPTDCKFQAGFPPLTCYSSHTVLPFGSVQRGDIIVFRFPEDEDKDFIKRVVGLPGDTIQIRNKTVLVNGTAFDDKGFTQRIDPGLIDGHINPRDNFGPVTVPEGIVLCDGRQSRPESRQPLLGICTRRKRYAVRRFVFTGPGVAKELGLNGSDGKDSAKPSSSPETGLRLKQSRSPQVDGRAILPPCVNTFNGFLKRASSSSAI